MIYISFEFYLFLFLILILYYIMPLKYRWIMLLAGNALFYLAFYKTGWWIFLCTIIISWCMTMIMTRYKGKSKKVVLFLGIVLAVMPWLFVKNGNLIWQELMGNQAISWVVPLGISFYTMQIIAYMADVYKGKCEPQRNLAKYALFVSFFPHIIQGPIPRYEQLAPQLIRGNRFNEKNMVRATHLIIYGFFLKLIIADKAIVIVDMVYDHYPAYSGFYIWIAALLYSVQIYADFLACTVLARGIALLFGIEIIDNFKQPYFATSIKDFWHRWHLSLSSWLRDYIYIPLGGSRKGKVMKGVNLLITFIVSGLWHGTGLKYIAWGIIYAFLQMGEDLIEYLKEKLHITKAEDDTSEERLIKRISTFAILSLVQVIFRADTLKTGLSMIKHMFTDFNPWILFNERIFDLGLVHKEVTVLALAIGVLFWVDKKHEEGIHLSEQIMKMKLPIRWGVYICAIISIMIFGTYGYGFNAQDFIYGGF